MANAMFGTASECYWIEGHPKTMTMCTEHKCFYDKSPCDSPSESVDFNDLDMETQDSMSSDNESEDVDVPAHTLWTDTDIRFMDLNNELNARGLVNLIKDSELAHLYIMYGEVDGMVTAVQVATAMKTFNDVYYHGPHYRKAMHFAQNMDRIYNRGGCVPWSLNQSIWYANEIKFARSEFAKAIADFKSHTFKVKDNWRHLDKIFTHYKDSVNDEFMNWNLGLGPQPAPFDFIYLNNGDVNFNPTIVQFMGMVCHVHDATVHLAKAIAVERKIDIGY